MTGIKTLTDAAANAGARLAQQINWPPWVSRFSVKRYKKLGVLRREVKSRDGFIYEFLDGFVLVVRLISAEIHFTALRNASPSGIIVVINPTSYGKFTSRFR